MYGKVSMDVNIYALNKDEERCEVKHYGMNRADHVNAIQLNIGGCKITIHGSDDLFTDLSVKISQAVLDAHVGEEEKAVKHVEA